LLEMDEKEMSVLQSGLFHLSLDAPLQEDGDSSSMLEQLPSPDSFAADRRVSRESLKLELRRCLSTLPDIQQQILQMFFGIDQREPSSLRIIAEELKLSEERIRQIKQKALGQLGSGKKRLLLQSYLS
jgi:RNA polymerase primary sigma factor